MKMNIGVDLHTTQFTVCYLEEGTSHEGHRKYTLDDKGIDLFLKDVAKFEEDGYGVQAAVEATGNVRYFRNRLLLQGIKVVVVNTLQFQVITKSTKKTDANDARILAEYLEKGMLPESHVCSQESEDMRRVLKSRTVLVQAVVKMKNQVHGLLRSYGIQTKRAELQSKKERQRILNGLEDQKEMGSAATAIVPLLDSIDNLQKEVKRLEKALKELVEGDEAVELLMTIPGVGLITASTIRAHTDDIHRFESAKNYASYMGVVPWVQNSNEKVKHGHITKRGPVELRTACVQAVLGMVRAKKQTGEYRLMEKYRAMKGIKGSGVSIIASARKLSTIIYMMLKNNEPFDPWKMVSSQKYIDMQASALNDAKAG